MKLESTYIDLIQEKNKICIEIIFGHAIDRYLLIVNGQDGTVTQRVQNPVAPNIDLNILLNVKFIIQLLWVLFKT